MYDDNNEKDDGNDDLSFMQLYCCHSGKQMQLCNR